jgi:hypothetical protein
MATIAARAPRAPKAVSPANVATYLANTQAVAGFQLVTDFARPDAKKRLSLGALHHLVSSYAIYQSPNGEVLLKPVEIVPANEAWLHRNPEALASVKRGLQQSAEGKTRSLGSFAKFAKD